jgi:hypothetical protein
MEKLIKIGNTGVTTAFQVKHFSIKGKKINFLEFMYLFKIYCISIQVQYRGLNRSVPRYMYAQRRKTKNIVRWPLFCLSFFKVTVPDSLCTMTIVLFVLLQSYCTWFPLYDDHCFVCPYSKLLYLILSVRWSLFRLSFFKFTVPDYL